LSDSFIAHQIPYFEIFYVSKSTVGVDDLRADMDPVDSGADIATHPFSSIPVASRASFSDICRSESVPVSSDPGLLRENCRKSQIIMGDASNIPELIQAGAFVECSARHFRNEDMDAWSSLPRHLQELAQAVRYTVDSLAMPRNT
jgi:hypothetical protein